MNCCSHQPLSEIKQRWRTTPHPPHGISTPDAVLLLSLNIQRAEATRDAVRISQPALKALNAIKKAQKAAKLIRVLQMFNNPTRVERSISIVPAFPHGAALRVVWDLKFMPFERRKKLPGHSHPVTAQGLWAVGALPPAPGPPGPPSPHSAEVRCCTGPFYPAG